MSEAAEKEHRTSQPWQVKHHTLELVRSVLLVWFSYHHFQATKAADFLFALMVDVSNETHDII